MIVAGRALKAWVPLRGTEAILLLEGPQVTSLSEGRCLGVGGVGADLAATGDEDGDGAGEHRRGEEAL